MNEQDPVILRARIRALIAALRLAMPEHYAGECGHCGIDELDPTTCPTLAFIARIEALIAESQT